MSLNQTDRAALLERWVRRSSDSEEDRMARAERMVGSAIDAHVPFDGYRRDFRVYTKGSYANDTNIRLDSDVDVVVENHGSYFHDYHQDVTQPSPDPSFTPYTGPWTPTEWRAEVGRAISNYFGSSEVDTTGEVAITVAEKPGSRPSADVVPAFLYFRYDRADRLRPNQGSKVFKKSGGSIINYPDQQLKNGNQKQSFTRGRYKQFVRALKNAENTLAEEGIIDKLPSYFMECLVYNVPNPTLVSGWSLDLGFRQTLVWLYQNLHADYEYENWIEPNELKYLFASGNKWSLTGARGLVLATWNYLGYGDD